MTSKLKANKGDTFPHKEQCCSLTQDATDGGSPCDFKRKLSKFHGRELPQDLFLKKP